MGCGEKSEVVMTFESAYWKIKHVRACVLYIFSLVASLLVASEQKNSFTSGCCVLRHMQHRIADGVLAALVLVIYAQVSLSFLAARSHG